LGVRCSLNRLLTNNDARNEVTGQTVLRKCLNRWEKMVLVE